MLTRHKKSSSTAALVLAADHRAVVDGTPMFTKSANEHKRATARTLVSGVNSRKIGKKVTKGPWKNFPIYTLTLEERATCPRDCIMWRACYGNRMPWSIRHQAGAELEAKIEREIADLQRILRGGFVVRLHVLGDFYSLEYVAKWAEWLERYPALHVFGYTARSSEDEIGRAVEELAVAQWPRFAIRSSGGRLGKLPAALVDVTREGTLEGIKCPAQTGATATCGTCALCWDAPTKTILFSEH